MGIGMKCDITNVTGMENITIEALTASVTLALPIPKALI